MIDIIYYLNIAEVKDQNGCITLQPKTWINALDVYSSEILSYTAAGIKTGKIKITFTCKLPANYDGTMHWIYPMVAFNSGIKGSWDRVIIAKSGTDLSDIYTDYEQVCNHRIETGAFFILPDGIGYNAVATYQFDTEVGTGTPWLEGLKLGESATPYFKAGDVIDITYYLNIAEVKDQNGSIVLNPKTWINSLDVYSQETYSYTDAGIKAGKIKVTFSCKLPADYDGTLHWIYPMVGLTSGIKGSWDRVIIAKSGTDLSGLYTDYTQAFSVNITTGPFANVQ